LKKLVSVLLTLAVVLGLSLTMAVLAAVSASNTPEIDGVISDGEWDGATVIDVESLNDLQTRLGQPLTSPDVTMGTVSVIADTDYLYVLVNVTDSTDARLGENIKGNDQVGLNINPTAGAPWGLPCDIIFQTGADPAAWGGTSSGTTDSWETDWEIDGVQQTLPGGLETMTLYNYTTSVRVSEWKVPLAPINPLPGDTLKVGGAIDVGDGNSYLYPVGLDWGDSGTYVDVLVQQGNTVVGLTADVPDIVAINVYPTSIDFGTLKPGQTSSVEQVTVTNIGTHTVDVDANLTTGSSDLFKHNLMLKNDPKDWSVWAVGSPWSKIVEGLAMDKSDEVKARLSVPLTYTPNNVERATLIFEATGV